MKLKIYEFDFGGAKDWMIATGKTKAKELHQAITGMDDEDYDKCIISLVKKENWDNYTYFNEDKRMTFAEFMENEAFEECFFCSTEY